MNFEIYKKSVEQIILGKKLPDSIYLHISSLKFVSKSLFDFVYQKISEIGLDEESWNIIKFFKKDFKISLLNYPNFFSDAYPVLEKSITIDLTLNTHTKRNYAKSKNPPILHRKETFLMSNHPAVNEFKEITNEGEKAGLYENKKVIGFKKNWEKLITQKGYQILNGRLFKKVLADNQVKNKIERHRTAIDRYNLSSPMQSLFRNGYLTGKMNLLDYGCGKGDDLRILAKHGIKTTGWDPVYSPQKKIQPHDIVNLGFVINVIEDQVERQLTLKKAFKLTKKLLVVAVMLGGERLTSGFLKHGDGIITKRNTFQKYYTQRELRDYIEKNLEEQAVAVAPGIFYIFKDKIEEQNYLVNREISKYSWKKLSYAGDPERLKVKQLVFYKMHRDIFDSFWEKALRLGRMPVNEEFSDSEQLKSICGSHQKAFRLLLTFHGEQIIEKAAYDRRNDLIVYFALGLFGHRKPYVKMPNRLKRDIKTFWGKYTFAIEESKSLLFSVGSSENIHDACEEAYKLIQSGYFLKNHSWVIHRLFLEQLPPVLRIYVGCATQLYGDIDEIDLIKIHINSGKVSLMHYDDFFGKPLPLLVERIKINMRQQYIDFFKYGEEFPTQPLYQKSLFLSKDMPNYSKQLFFDKKMKSFDWLDLRGYGPSHEQFTQMLQSHGFEIRGFRFFKLKMPKCDINEKQ